MRATSPGRSAQNRHRHPGQLWLRRHRAAARAVTVTQTFAPAHWPQDVTVQLKGLMAGVPQGMHPRRGNFTCGCHPEHHRAAQRCLYYGPKAQPQPLAKAGAQQQAQVDGDALQVRVAGLPAALRGKTLDLFPEMPEVLHNAAEGTQRWGRRRMDRPIPLAEQRSNSPSTPAPWCWPRRCKAAPPPGYRADLTVQGPGRPWPPRPACRPRWKRRSKANAALAGKWAAPAALRASSLTLTAHCWAPCWAGSSSTSCPACSRCWPSGWWALPATADRRAHRISGWPTPQASVLSFLALGALMLEPAGCGREAVGWGFQLQSPAVVAALKPGCSPSSG